MLTLTDPVAARVRGAAFRRLLHTSKPVTATDTDALITMSQLLPPDTPPHLVRTAHAIYGTCDPDTDFTFVLDLILTGARDLKRHDQAASPSSAKPRRRR